MRVISQCLGVFLTTRKDRKPRGANNVYGLGPGACLALPASSKCHSFRAAWASVRQLYTAGGQSGYRSPGHASNPIPLVLRDPMSCKHDNLAGPRVSPRSAWATGGDSVASLSGLVPVSSRLSPQISRHPGGTAAGRLSQPASARLFHACCALCQAPP
jgi:hypothetical protein